MGKEVFGIGLSDYGAEILNLLHSLTQTSLQAITESLTLLAAARQLYGQLLTTRCDVLPLWIGRTVPRCDG
jgi:hypothetical protein